MEAVYMKTKEWVLGLCMAVWTVLAPIHSILAAVFALVALDFVAGVYKSVIIDKKPFTSERMRHTVVKLVPYLLVILGGFSVDHIAALDEEWFTRAFAMLVCGVELRSLGEKTGFNLFDTIRDRLKPPAKDPVE